MNLYIILLVIISISILLIVYTYNDKNDEYYSYKPVSQDSYKKIIYPKSPIDATMIKKKSLNDDINIKNIEDYILIPKKNMSGISILPPGFEPVYEQNETLTGVISQEQMYLDNGVLNTKNIIIQKRYKNESRGEAICRKVLEDIYNEKFERIRPNFLKYHNGENLEIDCWCEKLKIGLEYNGKQHYQFTPHWQINQETFINQIQRDTFKIDKFNELGYYLITVPYIVNHNMIRIYIEYYLPENVNKREKSKNKNLNLLDL